MAALPKETVVFFARDFLSIEFPKMRAAFADLARVYLVMSVAEAANIAAHDPDGDVIVIGADVPADVTLVDDGEAIGRDRFLRMMNLADIETTRRAIAAACDRVLRDYRPIFYFDEPVSGYANEMFNRRFGESGALCLHFQTTWLPGYCFFVRDGAQASPVPLNLLPDSRAAVDEHIKLRAAGLAKPTYVLPYDRLLPRLKDLAKTLGSVVWRLLFRRKASYIDRDPAPHIFHARCLAKSLVGRYSADPVATIDAAHFVVFPLHYEPESLLKYFSRYYRQEEIASQILDSLPPGYKLVLKEHPSQPGSLHLPKWADLRASKRVVILRGDYRASRLMQLRPVVISLGSTFALEAALAGCPVGVIGDVHFCNAPGISRIDNPGEWQHILNAPSGSSEAIARWYADFINRHCFKGNFMRGQTWIEDLPRLVAELHQNAPTKTN